MISIISIKKIFSLILIIFTFYFLLNIPASAEQTVKIGLTAPLDLNSLEKRDPYWKQGLDQKRSVDMAIGQKPLG